MKTGTKKFGKLGYRGIYVDSRFKDSPFRVRVMFQGRRKRYGGFSTLESAARKYDAVVFGLWGDEAVLNFPKPKWTK